MGQVLHGCATKRTGAEVPVEYAEQAAWAGIDQVERIVADIGIEVDAAVVADGIGLQEPPEAG